MLEQSTYEIRLRAVQAVSDGISVTQVAKVYQTHRATVHRWLERSGRGSRLEGLVRARVSGRPKKIEQLNESKLRSIVVQPASRYGYETDLWTCRRLTQVIRKEFRKKLSHVTVWRHLRKSGLSYQKPERVYFELAKNVREDWIKTTLPKIRSTVRKHHAILYFEDEANISLSAILGKTWAPVGKTPTQRVTGKRGGVSAMSAISKSGSLVFRLVDTRIGSKEVISFLEQLLRHHKRRHLVVVMDRATPHTARNTQDFIASQKRLHVFYLPPYSPDWNPDEKVWNHLKHQELKSHQARTSSQLKKLAYRKLTKMANNPSQLRGIFFRCCVAILL